jgi:phage terminase large subunit GpA-like protein
MNSPALFEYVPVPKAVALALEHKPRVKCSEWSEESIVIPRVKNSMPGPWRNSVTIYLVKPMDTAALPHVRHIVMCAGGQLGKTQCFHNFLGYCADRDPGNTLVVMSDQEMARRIVTEKLRPLWRESEVLRSLTVGVQDALKINEFNLNHGMSIQLAWSSSESKLASIPYRYLILDETEKYEDPTAINNAKVRVRWFPHTHKIIEISTPKQSDGPIFQGLLECDVVYAFFVVCPTCGKKQRMRFEQIKWPEGERDPKKVKRKKLARYGCEHCEAQWTDLERDLAVRMGDYAPVNPKIFHPDKSIRAEAMAAPPPEDVERPESVGFQLSAIISPLVSLSALAAKFLTAVQSVNPAKGLEDLYNNDLGEPFDQAHKADSPKAAEILAHKHDIAPMILPPWAVGVTAGIDMQKIGFWFSVWAWGRDFLHQCALVQYGFLPDFAAVGELCHGNRYPIKGHEAVTLPIFRAGLDTGGGKGFEDWSRTAEAYAWLRAHGRVFGIKGASSRNAPKIKHSVIDSMPGKRGKPIPGGLIIYLLNTELLKDDFFGRMRVYCPNLDCMEPIPAGAGACPACGALGPADGGQKIFLHSDTGMDYAKQLLAEEKQRTAKGAFEWVEVHKDNHLLDTSIYGHAPADPQWLGGVRMLPNPLAVKPPPRAPSDKPSSPLSGRRMNPYRNRS